MSRRPTRGRPGVPVLRLASGTLLGARLLAAQPPAQPTPTPAAPSAPPPTEGALRVGRPATGRLLPPAVQRWSVALRAGEYAEVEVLQQGVDVTVRLERAGGQRPPLDATTGPRGTERVRWIADAGEGEWTIQLAPAPGAAAGAYEIRWTTRRPASAADRQVVLGDSLARVGGDLMRQGRYPEADSVLGRALAVRTAVLGAEHLDVASSLSNLALLNATQARYVEAESLYHRGLAIKQRALGPEHPDVATIVNNLAGLSLDQGRFAEAESLYRRGLALRERALGSGHPDVASSLNNLALFYKSQARYAEAEPLLRRSLAIKERTLGAEHPSMSSSLTNLGGVLKGQGRYAEAEPLYQRALAIRERALGAAHSDVGSALSNLAALYYDEGRYADAEPLFRRALAIKESVWKNGHPDVAYVLNNLAVVYEQQGRYAEAEPLYRRALAVNERVFGAEHPDVATSLSNLAGLYRVQGRYAEAEPLFRRALALRERALGADHPDVAGSLSNLASLYERQARHADAEPLARRALAIEEHTLGPEHPDVAGSLDDLARILLGLGGHAPEARALLDRAVRIAEARLVHDDDRIRAYALRAQVRRDQGDRPGALEDLAEAIRAAEDQRPRVGGGEATRAELFGRYAEQFDRMVGWQLEAGDVAHAVEYAERGRARVLLDQLAAARVDVRQGIPPDVRAPLEAREREARARVAEYQQRLTLLGDREDLSDAERDRQGAALEDSLRVADRDFAQAYDDLQNASPRWRSVVATGGRPVPLDSIQRGLVPGRGYLLLYHVGGEGSTLFVVPPAGARAEAVPLRVGAAEAKALGMQPGALTAAELARASAALAGRLGRSPRAPDAAPTDSLVGPLHALWRVLLPPAVWERIRSAAEVVVVPDRGLYLLPFEALVVRPPGAGQGVAGARFWIDAGPPVRYAASATALADLERRRADGARGARPDDRHPVGAILSLSNPEFDPTRLAGGDTARVAEVTRSASGSRVRATLAAWPSGAGVVRGGALVPLPGTAAESEAVRQAFAAEGDTVTVLQGREASEARLRAALGRAGGARYVHLATHALVDGGRSALFAALALTPPPAAARPSPDDDGFLQLHEIYQLDLPGLALAVLSACESGAGPAVDGEGVFALSRGFHAAGAQRVVASDWVVDDRSTAVLMRGLFTGIAAGERGGGAVDYAAALRDAKRAVRAQPRWAHPYYWAPFVLTGTR